MMTMIDLLLGVIGFIIFVIGVIILAALLIDFIKNPPVRRGTIHLLKWRTRAYNRLIQQKRLEEE